MKWAFSCRQIQSSTSPDIPALNKASISWKRNALLRSATARKCTTMCISVVLQGGENLPPKCRDYLALSMAWVRQGRNYEIRNWDSRSPARLALGSPSIIFNEKKSPWNKTYPLEIPPLFSRTVKISSLVGNNGTLGPLTAICAN